MKQVTFYVGIGTGMSDMERHAVLPGLLSIMATLFGGCTVTEGWGVWVTGPRIISERQLSIVVVGDYVPQSVTAFAAWLRRTFNQECVMAVEHQVSVSYLDGKAAGPASSQQPPATPMLENPHGAEGTDRSRCGASHHGQQGTGTSPSQGTEP